MLAAAPDLGPLGGTEYPQPPEMAKAFIARDLYWSPAHAANARCPLTVRLNKCELPSKGLVLGEPLLLGKEGPARTSPRLSSSLPMTLGWSRVALDGETSHCHTLVEAGSGAGVGEMMKEAGEHYVSTINVGGFGPRVREEVAAIRT